MKKLWKKIKHWCCEVGLCNLDKCCCDCHPKGRSKAYYPTPAKKKQAVAMKSSKIGTKATVSSDGRTKCVNNEDGTTSWGSSSKH